MGKTKPVLQCTLCGALVDSGNGLPMHEETYAVLRVEAMPRQWRQTLENVMAKTIASPPPSAMPGTDPLEAVWFTPWRTNSWQPNTVDCRQVLNGTLDELRVLSQEVAALAATQGFSACVEFV
ncbi:hypothetical protein [Corynebacterium diphtheriae]|uniref:hypothetical protein n=1 Tax=Corynebacterium diphtheriae TaxID=1717 RepID=UPI003530D6B3